MNDFLAETPNVAAAWCPDCEPGRDPIAEVLEVRWCFGHGPVARGEDDARAATDRTLNAGPEADGYDCRIMQGFIR
jgi:hypothetical protein